MAKKNTGSFKFNTVKHYRDLRKKISVLHKTKYPSVMKGYLSKWDALLYYRCAIRLRGTFINGETTNGILSIAVSPISRPKAFLSDWARLLMAK